MSAPTQQILVHSKPFTPADISTLIKGWYRGDLLTGNNGDTIQTWADQSGNGNDISQATSGKRPTLVTSDLNSKNTVRFTSANATVFTMPNLLSGASQASIYCVYKAVNDPALADASSGGLIKIGSQGGGSAANHWPYSDGIIYDDFGSANRQDVGNPSFSLSSTYRIIGIQSSSTEYRWYFDGTSFYSNSTNTPGFTSTPEMGHFASGSTQIYANAFCAEVIICNNILTDGQRQKIEGWLAWQWALTGNLPSGHPYKNSPPTT
jgi:hypothetical protein